MKRALALRHVPFEDLGCFEQVLANRGFDVAYLEAPQDDLSALSRTPPDLLVVLGGPIGVYDTGDYPFLAEEIRLLEGRLSQRLPTLGLCLGAQLMARALGARVYPTGGKEIGWAPVRLTDAGRASCLAPLAEDGVAVLHWHGDTFDLPEGATRLASTDFCENQAFSFGPEALALQFHLEATASGLESWFVGHTCEIAATPGISVAELRSDTVRHAERTQAIGAACLETWLTANGF